jgi:hypothetical protein
MCARRGPHIEPPASRRPGRVGDICVLFAPSRPIIPAVRHRLERLRSEFGGRIVEPLHLTLERTDGEDADGLTAAVREYGARAGPLAVRGEKLFVTRSPYRGSDVLKLHVTGSEPLRRQIDTLRSTIQKAGLRSLYGDERATSVTVLEQIERDGPLEGWPFPLELFVADELIVSRILGASRYDILDRIAVP